MAIIPPANRTCAPKATHAHKFPRNHKWNPTPAEARQVQDRLKEFIRVEPLSLEEIHRVAGVDAICHQGMICAALAVLDFPQLKPIEQAVVEIPLSFPCISFRQTPGILAALKQLSQC